MFVLIVRVALALALVARPVSAQTLTGRVVDEGVGTPVAGAIVSVIDRAGERVRSVLTNAGGRYVLSGLPAGPHRVRIEMIGRRSVESEELELVAGVELPPRTFELPAQPITLSGIDVSTAERCTRGREAALDTYTVWQEAEKALRAASLTSAQPLYRFRVASFERTLDPRSGDPRQERREEQLRVSADPFNSLAPAEIERAGYVREEGGETLIYGPNTDLLISSEFQTTHCFWLRRDRDRPERIGLAFEPVAGRTLPEIEGVLWIDAASAELRSLEFRYRNLPDRLVRGDYTGYAEFLRLTEGTWIIQSWRLRSPVLEQGAEVRSIERVGGEG